MKKNKNILIIGWSFILAFFTIFLFYSLASLISWYIGLVITYFFSMMLISIVAIYSSIISLHRILSNSSTLEERVLLLEGALDESE